MNNLKLWIHIALLTTTMLIVGNATAQETANIPATNQVQLTQPSLSAPIQAPLITQQQSGKPTVVAAISPEVLANNQKYLATQKKIFQPGITAELYYWQPNFHGDVEIKNDWWNIREEYYDVNMAKDFGVNAGNAGTVRLTYTFDADTDETIKLEQQLLSGQITQKEFQTKFQAVRPLVNGLMFGYDYLSFFGNKLVTIPYSQNLQVSTSGQTDIFTVAFVGGGKQLNMGMGFKCYSGTLNSSPAIDKGLSRIAAPSAAVQPVIMFSGEFPLLNDHLTLYGAATGFWCPIIFGNYDVQAGVRIKVVDGCYLDGGYRSLGWFNNAFVQDGPNTNYNGGYYGIHFSF